MNRKGNTPSQLALSSPNGSRGFAPVLVLLTITLIAAIAGGVYYLGRAGFEFRPTPVAPPVSSTPTLQQDETANWKTHTSKKYSFSFKYPNDWGLGTVCDGVGGVVPELPSLGPEYLNDPQAFCATDHHATMSFWTSPKYLKEVMEFTNFKIKKSNIAVGGKNAEYLSIIDTSPEDELYGPRERVIVIVRLSDTELVASELTDINQKEIFDKILSTFRFD